MTEYSAIIRTRLNLIAVFGVLLLITFTLRFNTFSEIPNRDTGVFAHMGQIIVEGRTPYLDSWDHKTPMIYFLNAGIFSISGISFRNMAIFEFFWVLLTLAFFYKFASSLFKTLPAVLCLVLFSLYAGNPAFSPSFGMPETYMLLPSMLAVYFILKPPCTGGCMAEFLSGMCISIAFLFRQTGIVVLVPVLFIIASGYNNNPGMLFKRLFFLTAGIAVPAALMLAYFVPRGAFNDLIDQVFIYNLHYISQTKSIKLDNVFGVFIFTRPALLLAALLGAVLFIFKLPSLKRSADSRLVTGTAILIWLILDILSVSISKRFYGHYFIQLLPATALISGFIFEKISGKKIRLICAASVILILIFSGATSGLESSVRQALKKKETVNINGTRYSGSGPVIRVTDWVLKNTASYDGVYLLGAEPEINFAAGRKIPTKFSYMYPLLNENYVTAESAGRFYTDISTNKPVFIIDINNYLEKYEKQLKDGIKATNSFSTTLIPELMERNFKYIIDNYYIAGAIEGGRIYRLKNASK